MNAEEYNRLLGERREARETANPELRLRREQVEREREERVARSRAEQEPLLADLRAVGCIAQGVYDLVNYRGSYPEAIPVLLKHVQRVPPYSETILTGLIRALTVKEGKGVFNKIALRMFREDTHEPSANGVRWCLANALTVVAGIDDVDEMIAFVTNVGHAGSRTPLVDALARFLGRRPDIVEVLESLCDDPFIKKRVQIVLSRKSVEKAREELKRTRGLSS